MRERVSKPIVLILLGSALVSFIAWRVAVRPAKPTDGPLSSQQSTASSQATASEAGEIVLTNLVAIPLTPILADAENGMWQSNKDYLLVPRGIQTFGGIEFHLDGMLQMQGTGSEAQGCAYRKQVLLPLAEAGVVNARMGSIHLLGGTRFQSEPGAEVAELVWRYTDGSFRRTRLVYGEHVRDWSRMPYEEPARLPYPHTKAVWRAPQADSAGCHLRLYRVSIGNPLPEKAVRGTDLTSGRGAATLFVVAATVDPLEPGMRPDDSPDLEPTDPAPSRYLEASVQTPEGQPLPQAKVRLEARLPGDRANPLTKEVTTDGLGLAKLSYTPAKLDRLEITASHEDYASRKMVWDVKRGETAPSAYTLKLTGGVNIGGIVVDSSDSAIAGAKVSFQRGGEDINQKGEQSGFTARNAATDSRGMWQMKHIPGDLIANGAVRGEHPEYMPTNVVVSRRQFGDSALRVGTFKLVLPKGVEVRGIVTEENGTPIEGATVFEGRPLFKSRQQTNSDSAGRFVFQGVREGLVIFSAMAKGRKPAGKIYKVSVGMNEVRLQLIPGALLKGIVRNKAGEPLAAVQVSLESFQRDAAFEFATTTRDDGRFEWDGAPDGSLASWFAKSGYRRQRVQLKAGEDNSVTLRKSFDVQGMVLDADSGKPVTNFHAAVGQSGQDFVNASGQFTLSVGDEGQNDVQVTADNYVDQVQSLGKDQDGPVNLEFRLKPSSSMPGTVVGTDGAPLPNVQVALSSVSWRGDRLQGKVVMTDAAGKFNLSVPPETGGNMVALGETGFACVPLDKVRDTGVIVLQPFGRIEGILKIAGQPAAGSWLQFTFPMTFPSACVMPASDFKVETDAEGRFQIEKVPAGQGQLARVTKVGEFGWSYNHHTSVNVEAGRTTTINLGDSGGVIRGRARVQNPPVDQPLSISGSLDTRFPAPPPGSSPAELRARMIQSRGFPVSVNPDGSFVVDSVPAGDYNLSLRAAPPYDSSFGPPTGPNISQTVTVTVPDNPDPGSPIDVGEVVLQEIKRKP